MSSLITNQFGFFNICAKRLSTLAGTEQEQVTVPNYKYVDNFHKYWIWNLPVRCLSYRNVIIPFKIHTNQLNTLLSMEEFYFTLGTKIRRVHILTKISFLFEEKNSLVRKFQYSQLFAGFEMLNLTRTNYSNNAFVFL